jgi:hypothetical protein
MIGNTRKSVSNTSLDKILFILGRTTRSMITTTVSRHQTINNNKEGSQDRLPRVNLGLLFNMNFSQSKNQRLHPLSHLWYLLTSLL